MSDDAPSLGARKRSWPRIAGLLVLIALVCGVVAWLVQPKRVAATALFEVRNEKPFLVGDQAGQTMPKYDYEILKKTQIALLKSKFLLRSALRNRGVAALPVFAGVADPEEWLQDHLDVSFPQNGELLAITLNGSASQSDELCQIVNAVAEAYVKEVLGAEKSRHLSQRDLLEKSLLNLNAEIKRKYEDYLDIAKGMGKVEGSNDFEQQLGIKRLERIDEELAQLERDQLKSDTGSDSKDSKFVAKRTEQLRKHQAELHRELEKRAEKSVVLETMKNDREQLQGIANDLSNRLEKMDMALESPARIQQVQPAVVDRVDIVSQ